MSFSAISYALVEQFPDVAQSIRRLNEENYTDPHIEFHAVRGSHLLCGVAGTHNISALKRMLTYYGIPQEDYDRALANACAINDCASIELLLEDGNANIGAGDSCVLRWACSQGRIDIVQMLMKRSCNPAAKENEAFRVACVNGFTEIVDILLKDSRVNPCDKENEAFVSACKHGHTTIVKRLIRLVRLGEEGEYALRYACAKGHVDIVRLILTCTNIDPSLRGNLALKWANTLYNMNSSACAKEIIDMLVNDPRTRR